MEQTTGSIHSHPSHRLEDESTIVTTRTETSAGSSSIIKDSSAFDLDHTKNHQPAVEPVALVQSCQVGAPTVQTENVTSWASPFRNPDDFNQAATRCNRAGGVNVSRPDSGAKKVAPAVSTTPDVKSEPDLAISFSNTNGINDFSVSSGCVSFPSTASPKNVTKSHNKTRPQNPSQCSSTPMTPFTPTLPCNYMTTVAQSSGETQPDTLPLHLQSCAAPKAATGGDDGEIPSLSEDTIIPKGGVPKTRRSSTAVSCPPGSKIGPLEANPTSRSTTKFSPTQEATAAPPQETSPLRKQSKPRLSLSAFRKPEQTVRLTDSDPSRLLQSEYDLASARSSGVLGHGASSTVRLAVRRSDGTAVAVKCIAKHDALRSRLRRHHSRRHLDEWEVLDCLSAVPNVVALLDVFETDEEVQLVLEYCPGGELFDAIRSSRYTESQAARITSQVLSALSEMHSRGVVHRDVKPENILLLSSRPGETRVKLSDFGVARVLHRERSGSVSSSSSSESGESDTDGGFSPATPLRARAYSRVGSDYYAAPEVLSGNGYDTSVDVYSLGVTLYILLCGFPPSFSSEQSRDEDEPHVDFPDAHWRDVSAEAKALIRRMLNPDPSRRITADEALGHSWIVNNCCTKDQEAAAASSAKRTHASLPTATTAVNLEFVRDRLHAGSGVRKRCSKGAAARRKKKRRRASPPASPSFMTVSLVPAQVALSMAELYRGVASAAEAATAAAAGVIDNDGDILVMDEEIDGVGDEAPDRSPSPFGGVAAMTALSV